MPYTCGGCNDDIKRQRVACSRCKKSYHQACVNYNGPQSLPATRISPNWLCPECIARSRCGGDNSSTPVRTLPPDNAPVMLTNPSVGSVSDTDEERPATVPVTPIDISLDDKIIRAIRTEIKNSLKDEVSCMVRAVLQAELAPIRQDLTDLKQSLEFVSSRQEEIEKSLDTLGARVVSVESTIKEIQPSVQDLEDRINDLEQQLRDTNLEFHGITEHNSENLNTVVLQAASTVSHQLSEADIVHCTRVAKLKRESNKPRTVVLKLSSRRLRDEFFSAISRFNKSNPTNKLNTSLLGLPGGRSPVFVSEHLSPFNKQLHAATRIKCKELQYKFVWVRNGRILVRKNESSRPIVVKNYTTLNLLH